MIPVDIHPHIHTTQIHKHLSLTPSVFIIGAFLVTIAVRSLTILALLVVIIVVIVIIHSNILVLLILGHQVAHVGLRLCELHFVHAFPCVPVKEGLASEHGRELFRYALFGREERE